MRLLRTSNLTFKDFYETELPEYAILSHRWGDEEALYKDVLKGRAKGVGMQKISDFCDLARLDGHEWAWVDTCCVDQKSSAELSEAINSMYRWYKNAQRCYAYLADVEKDDYDSFERSSWFRRGWTLQELIAPFEVAFFDQNWESVGSKHQLIKRIHAITDIPIQTLGQCTGGARDDDSCCIAQRMSWASKRETSRPEDMAYCMIGLFNVNMPLLYGEGRWKAFRRLQLEILRTESDDSIFMWDTDPPTEAYKNQRVLASSPENFTWSGLRECTPTGAQTPMSIVWNTPARGMEITLPSGRWVSYRLKMQYGDFPATWTERITVLTSFYVRDKDGSLLFPVIKFSLRRAVSRLLNENDNQAQCADDEWKRQGSFELIDESTYMETQACENPEKVIRVYDH